METAEFSKTSDGNPFDSLDYVFSQAFTGLLTPTEEREYSEELWQRRRRVRLAMIWLDSPDVFNDEPPLPAVHRNPIPSGMARRLIATERRARQLVNEVSDHPALELVRSELARMDELRDQLFHRNLRLIAWIARGYLGKGLELADLFQEGSIALLSSVERFDPAREVRLSTFASHAIRLGLVRALTDRGRPIRVPNYRMREVVETSKARLKLVHKFGREPRRQEIESETGLSGQAIDEILPAVRPLLRFDAPIGGSDAPLSEFLFDGKSRSPFERFQTSERKQRTNKAISSLPSRERKIVAMRYGLAGDGDEHTFEDIGRALGLSRERARQLERSAREKLRTLLRDAG